ncbi:MAG: hypothetical protein IMZ61_05565 [Planctomycetes bacterium]|nr:hypothetical protein [Planctomycetota bacterium]
MTLLLDALLKEKLVTSEQINDARDKQAGANKSIYEVPSIWVFSGQENLKYINNFS